VLTGADEASWTEIDTGWLRDRGMAIASQIPEEGVIVLAEKSI
jgi:hypothetical protein